MYFGTAVSNTATPISNSRHSKIVQLFSVPSIYYSKAALVKGSGKIMLKMSILSISILILIWTGTGAVRPDRLRFLTVESTTPGQGNFWTQIASRKSIMSNVSK